MLVPGIWGVDFTDMFHCTASGGLRGRDGLDVLQVFAEESLGPVDAVGRLVRACRREGEDKKKKA